jgi:predicted O-methyltransferase YrrM
MGIRGYTSPIELSFLYHATLALPGRGRIVEIGSYVGRSTVVLAAAAANGAQLPVVAVDPHTGDLTVGNNREDTEAEFAANVQAAGVDSHVHGIRSTSVEAAAAWSGEAVDLLFIDGLHTREAVLADVHAWAPFISRGACVVFDDYLVYPAVREAISELRKNGMLPGTPVVVGKMIAFADRELMNRCPVPPGGRLLGRLPVRSIDSLNRLLDRIVA